MQLIRRTRERTGEGDRPARRLWTTTRSIIINGLRRGDHQVAFPALCQAYWQPVFVFIRAIGCEPDEARDVTQALFEAMLNPGFFDRFDPSLGRFRNWLRTAARHFYLNSKRKRRPELAAVEQAAIEESAQLASNGTSDTDRAFDRALIQVIVQRALARLRQQYVEAGEEKVFTHLELSVVGERQRTYYAAVSKVVGKSVPLLKKEQYVAKEDWLMRYRGCLREELAALGVRRACIERVMEELLDASR